MSSDDINNFYQVPPPQQRENLTYIDAEGGEKNNKMMMLKIHHRIANDHRTIYEYDNSHLLEADDYESENANDSSNNTNHYNLSDSALDSPDSIGIDTSMISCSTRSMDTIDNMHNASIEESPSLQHDMRSRKPLILSDYYSFQRPMYELMHEPNPSSHRTSSSSESNMLMSTMLPDTAVKNNINNALDMEVEGSQEPMQQDSSCPTCNQIFSVSSSSPSPSSSSAAAAAAVIASSSSSQQEKHHVALPKACNFCMKNYCHDTCLLPCDTCSEAFCRNCSTPNYATSHGCICCLDCSQSMN